MCNMRAVFPGGMGMRGEVNRAYGELLDHKIHSDRSARRRKTKQITKYTLNISFVHLFPLPSEWNFSIFRFAFHFFRPLSTLATSSSLSSSSSILLHICIAQYFGLPFIRVCVCVRVRASALLPELKVCLLFVLDLHIYSSSSAHLLLRVLSGCPHLWAPVRREKNATEAGTERNGNGGQTENAPKQMKAVCILFMAVKRLAGAETVSRTQRIRAERADRAKGRASG